MSDEVKTCSCHNCLCLLPPFACAVDEGVSDEEEDLQLPEELREYKGDTKDRKAVLKVSVGEGREGEECWKAFMGDTRDRKGALR